MGFFVSLGSKNRGTDSVAITRNNVVITRSVMRFHHAERDDYTGGIVVGPGRKNNVTKPASAFLVRCCLCFPPFNA
jgi:hypothetical protein